MTKPADVFVRVGLFRAELEILRQELGRPRDDRGKLAVTNAAPREVLYEALALFRKSDRLCFERTGNQGVVPQPPAADKVEPAHVKAVVDFALGRLALVKTQLGITDKAEAPARDDAKQPSDVLASLFAANRQLNGLLDQPFTPNDVYQLVSLAVGYASRLTARLDNPPPVELSELERKKRPGDVYARLWSCFSSLREAITGSGLEVLDLGKPPYEVDDVIPSDVYDLASLLISELVYLHSQVDGLEPPSTTDFYEVGHKVPAHVYQIAGLLEAQVAALAATVKADASVLVGS
jgi:hypothetical protein